MFFITNNKNVCQTGLFVVLYIVYKPREFYSERRATKIIKFL